MAEIRSAISCVRFDSRGYSQPSQSILSNVRPVPDGAVPEALPDPASPKMGPVKEGREVEQHHEEPDEAIAVQRQCGDDRNGDEDPANVVHKHEDHDQLDDARPPPMVWLNFVGLDRRKRNEELRTRN